jgi:hypothetical protein
MGQSVTLADSYVFDWEGDPLTVTWEVTSRPPGSTASLSDPTALHPSFLPDEPGVYVLSLTASDGVITGAADTVSLTVTQCEAGVDTDSDGFNDNVECYLGTDPIDSCPDDTSDDAWPLDVNKDARLSVVGDVLSFRDRIGATPGTPTWSQRLDYNGDGRLSVVGDVLMYRNRIGETCK